MAKFPYLPIFTDSYMADTRHLTAAQHGAYLLLLMTAWRMPDCKLPDDDVFLSRCASMDLRTWRVNKGVVMSFWKKDEQQKFYQGKLLDVRKNVDDKRSKNSDAGKASALKRLNRQSTDVKPDTKHKTNESKSKEQNIREDIKPLNPLFVLPDWMPRDLWDSWMQVRKTIKAVNSERAQAGLIARLQQFSNQGHDPCKLVEMAIINSWKNVYLPKEDYNGKHQTEPKSTATLRAAHDAIAIRKAQIARQAEASGG